MDRDVFILLYIASYIQNGSSAKVDTFSKKKTIIDNQEHSSWKKTWEECPSWAAKWKSLG